MNFSIQQLNKAADRFKRICQVFPTKIAQPKDNDSQLRVYKMEDYDFTYMPKEIEGIPIEYIFAGNLPPEVELYRNKPTPVIKDIVLPEIKTFSPKEDVKAEEAKEVSEVPVVVKRKRGRPPKVR